MLGRFCYFLTLLRSVFLVGIVKLGVTEAFRYSPFALRHVPLYVSHARCTMGQYLSRVASLTFSTRSRPGGAHRSAAS